MLQVQVDEQQLLEMAREEIQAKLKTVESEFVFWDVKTLCQKTCMSKSFVLNTFFHQPDFPKFRVGTKWLIPATEGKEWLLQWARRNSA